MEIKKAREIVIEIERIRTTRKRCRTQILFCTGCELDTDFITLGAATALFEVERDQLRPLIGHHICKDGGTEGDILICVATLLEKMRIKANPHDLKKAEKSAVRLINS